MKSTHLGHMAECFSSGTRWGGGKGNMALSGPDQQPKILLEITILDTIFEKFSALLCSASQLFFQIFHISQQA